MTECSAMFGSAAVRAHGANAIRPAGHRHFLHVRAPAQAPANVAVPLTSALAPDMTSWLNAVMAANALKPVGPCSGRQWAAAGAHAPRRACACQGARACMGISSR